jgi:hypothetical protein
MSEKMTSQNELTEIKLVPYNKPLNAFFSTWHVKIIRVMVILLAHLKSCWRNSNGRLWQKTLIESVCCYVSHRPTILYYPHCHVYNLTIKNLCTFL